MNEDDRGVVGIYFLSAISDMRKILQLIMKGERRLGR
jgi:hypothetical protein